MCMLRLLHRYNVPATTVVDDELLTEKEKAMSTSNAVSNFQRMTLALLMVASLALVRTEPAEATTGNVRVICIDQASTNAMGVEVPASGQTHVFARYKVWTSSGWKTIYESPVNALPQSMSYGQYIQVSTYYLPGFYLYNVGAGHHRVDVYSYYPGDGWKLHHEIYHWNSMVVGYSHCTMT